MAIVPHHLETSQLICNTSQLAGFYMIGNIGLYGLVVRQLVRQSIHSFPGDNDVVPLHLWRNETVPKCFVQD